MDLQQTSTFFIQVAPGFEELAILEFKQKATKLAIENFSIKKETGGFEIELPIDLGLKLPAYLKVANRILLRLDQFKCRDLPKLYTKIKKKDWRFFNAAQEFTFHVSSNQSRLFDDRKIEKTLREGLLESFKAFPPKKKKVELIHRYKKWHFFCRFDQDMCTLSLDICGERLSKRGYKTASGKAPLRENIAAGLWLFATQDLARPPQSILDPFAGSGTLLCESALFMSPNQFRAFNAQALADHQCPTENISKQELKLFAYEKDATQFHCMKKNIKECNLEADLYHQDNTLPTNLGNVDLIITNPPFNKRVKSNHHFWRQNIDAKVIGLLLPRDQRIEIEHFKITKQLSFKHGGLDVTFNVYHRL